MPQLEESYYTIEFAENAFLHVIGPPLDRGPLPGLFYFALSGRDSLLQDPYNQCLQQLPLEQMRCFSLTLPGHEDSSKYITGIAHWAACFAAGKDLLGEFTALAMTALDHLERLKILAQKIAVAGLSRGAFIASHLAAKDKRVCGLLGFAPLTRLDKSPDFLELNSSLHLADLDLINIVAQLARLPVKFFIGNRDLRVGTRHCFDFIDSLANAAYLQGLRSPPVELSIYPSVGYQGHGTPPEIFTAGANWIKTILQLD